MSTCKRITKTNGTDSKLFNRVYLLANNNEELADEYYSYFKSNEFKEQFGDYIEDYKEEPSLRKIRQSNIDDNGEPILFLEPNKNKYYYLDKHSKKVYFPKKENKLKSIFSNEDINSITDALVYHYAKNNNLFGNFDDIDTEKIQKESLSESIKKKLQGKIFEYSKSGDFHKETIAEYLQDSLKYLDEWTNEAVYKFRALKLVYSEKFEEEELNEEEFSQRGQSFDKASFETSYKQGINSDVKLILSFLQDPTKVDNVLNEPIFLPFDEVYGTLLNVLNSVSISEGEDVFEKYLDIINKYASYKPYLKNLSRMLSSPKLSEHTKNKFSQAFRLDKINYLTTTISRVESDVDGGVFVHTVQNISSVGSKSKIIMEQWNVNFQKLYYNDKGRFTNESKVKLAQLLKEVNEFSLEFDRSNIKNLDSNITTFLNLIKKLGVETTLEGVNFYLNNNSADEITEEDKFNNLRKLVTASKYLLTRIQDGKVSFKKGTILNDQSEIDNLSRSEAWFSPEGSDSSIFAANKSKWVFSKPSYLSTKIKLWKNNPKALLQHYLSTPYTRGSYYMEYFLAFDVDEKHRERVSTERLNKFDIGLFNSLQEEGDASNAVDGKTLSENDQFADFLNKILSFKKQSESWVSTPTPADKNNQYEINYGEVFVNTKLNFEVVNGGIVINSLGGQVEDILFNYFKSEYERMKVVSQEILYAKENDDYSQLRSHYHFGMKNGLKSQIFPSFSPTFNGDTVNIPEMNGLHLYDEKTGHPIKIQDEYVNLDAFKDQIVQLMLPLVEKNITKTYLKLREINIIDVNDKGESVNNAVDSEIFNSYANEGIKSAGFRLSADAFINGLISQVEYSKMFSGDTAYYKNMVDYKKRIPATYTDGLQLRLKEGEQMYNASVIEDIIIDEHDVDEIEKIAGKKIANMYRGKKKVNSADAQCWITPQRWKFLIDRLGKGSKQTDTVYNKMIGKNNKPFTEKELKLVAQPLKGVYFEINSNVPVYLKYSQAVLLPKLIKGSQLETLYNKMVLDDKGNVKDYNSQIHEVITSSGVKVGSIEPVSTNDDKGNLKDFTLTQMQLKNSGWKLQQDLPVKGMHDTMVGSQIQKNIFQGLAFNLDEDFNLAGNNIKGQDLLDQINDVVGELSKVGFEELIDDLGINESGKITNVEKFYSVLADELKERGGSRNIIEALEAEISPYGIPQSKSKINNIFASLVNKKIIKIKTNGGSFIQMSNYGLNFNEATERGVILLTDSLRTHMPKENEDGSIQPGGVFISGSFIAKYIPDYRQFIDKYGVEEFKKSIDPEILKNIIGYRIPNQGLASNDALEIIGILPEETGDTIVAYTGITTKTGSDFDIDKMYLMMPSFKYEDGRLTYIKYDESIGVELQQKEALQNRLIESYKAVLTNKKVLKDVLTPIDFDYIKDMILDLYPEKTLDDLAAFNSFDDISLKYEFKAGKAGVGQEANALVDHVRGMMADLSFVKYNLGVGYVNEEGSTDFDREFSKPLSDKDMEENNIPEELRSIKISNTLSAILNAFVDIAKDPYITRGNWTTLTTNTGNMLLRAGVHPAYVTSFLAQPILKEYVKFSNNRESKIVNDTGNIKEKFQLDLVSKNLDDGAHNYIEIGDRQKTYSSIYKALVKKAPSNRSVDEVEGSLVNLTPEKVAAFINIPLTNNNSTHINQIINKIASSHKNIFYTKIKEFKDISLKELNDEIKNKETSVIQLSVLNAFFNFKEKSKEIRNNVMASKLDVEGMGKSYISLLSTTNLIDQLLDNENNGIEGSFKGFGTKLQKDNKVTLLGHYHNGIVKMKKIMELNPTLFFTAHEGIINTFNEISKDIKNTLLTDPKLGEVLEEEYYSYLMSGFQPLQMSNQEKLDLISNFPSEFDIFKKEHKVNYALLEELSGKAGDGGRSYIGLSNRRKSAEDETRITDSWSDLLNDFPEFGEKLIKYSFLTSGFKMNKSQFYTLIPHQWFIQHDVNSYLTKQSRNIQDFDNSFVQQLYKNNVKNNQLVPLYFDNEVSKVRSDYPTVKDFYVSSLDSAFKMNTTTKARFFVKKIVETELEDGEVDTQTLLYALKGYDKDYRPIYIRVNPLGYTDLKGNKVVEYGFNQTVTPSITPNIKVNMEHYNDIQKDVVYPFDYYNQYINVQEAKLNKKELMNTPTLELAESETPRFLIKVNGTEVGFIDYSEESGQLHIENMVVHDEFRGNSYGKQSLSLIEKATGLKINRSNQESELGKKMMDKFDNEKFFNDNKDEILNKFPDMTLDIINQMNEEEINKLKDCL